MTDTTQAVVTLRAALTEWLGSLPSMEDWDTPADATINRAHVALDTLVARIAKLEEFERQALTAHSAQKARIAELEGLFDELEQIGDIYGSAIEAKGPEANFHEWWDKVRALHPHPQETEQEKAVSELGWHRDGIHSHLAKDCPHPQETEG